MLFFGPQSSTVKPARFPDHVGIPGLLGKTERIPALLLFSSFQIFHLSPRNLGRISGLHVRFCSSDRLLIEVLLILFDFCEYSRLDEGKCYCHAGS